jgi:hypothetical protein
VFKECRAFDLILQFSFCVKFLKITLAVPFKEALLLFFSFSERILCMLLLCSVNTLKLHACIGDGPASAICICYSVLVLYFVAMDVDLLFKTPSSRYGNEFEIVATRESVLLTVA